MTAFFESHFSPLCTADPLLIDEIKEEICEENEVTPIQDLSEVSIKQGEFGASEYHNEQESEMFDLEIKEELINPFVEHEKTMETKRNNESNMSNDFGHSSEKATEMVPNRETSDFQE